MADNLRNTINDGDCTFNDDEHINELDRQTISMLWSQIKICFYRMRLNDLFYNGHTLSTHEVFKLKEFIDLQLAEHSQAHDKYISEQFTISSGGRS